MPRGPEPVNPFYVLLVVVGVVFTLTSCAYAVMVFKATQPLARVDMGAPVGLLAFLNTYGGWLLGGELLALGVATFGAIAVDDRRIKRRERDKF